MRPWIGASPLILLIVVNACAPTKTIVRDRSLNAAEVVRLVEERDRRIRTLKGDGNITVESPEQSGSGSFRADVRKPDSLKLELSGPFGIHVGTLLLSREQFMFYNWRENVATIGRPDGSMLQSMFRLRLRFDEILRAFTGDFLSARSSDTLEKFSIEHDLYLLRYRNAEGIHEYRVDRDLFVVTSYRLLDSLGKPSLIALASRFDEVDNLTIPKLLRVVLPKERRSLTVAYGDVTLNGEVECTFVLPKQAEVVRQ